MNRSLILLCCIFTFGAFAQGTSTPAVKIQEAKYGKAVVFSDNGAGGFATNNVDSSSTILFEYNYKAAQINEIADDEYREIIGFNIVADKTGKFEVKGDAIKKANGYLYKGCFCIDRGNSPIVGGTIKGVRMTKTTWYINADLKISINKGEAAVVVSKKIKGTFKIIPAS
jgi:hypothetical protein